MRVLVLLNRGAGSVVGASAESVAERVRAGFAAHGADAEVQVVEGDMHAAAAAGARGDWDAVVAGGGDGTINTVASALVGTDKPFGVLPLGTFNHFAKDIGLPADLDEAIAAVARATPRAIDVAEVNGRPFLNFTGIGLHPAVVHARESLHEPRRRNKLVAFLLALVTAVRRMPVLRVGIRDGEIVRWRVTPSAIVCTNAHQLRLFGVKGECPPERGVLNLYVAKPTRWYAVLWLVLRAALHRLDTKRAFEVTARHALELHLRHRHVTVTIDREVETLKTPLVYRVRRRALWVLAPPPRGAAPP